MSPSQEDTLGGSTRIRSRSTTLTGGCQGQGQEEELVNGTALVCKMEGALELCTHMCIAPYT